MLKGWGNSTHGELGLGGIEDEHINDPLSVPFAEPCPVMQVGCGLEHSVVLLSDGRVFSCGNNNQGQLGRSTCSYRKLWRVDDLSPYNTVSVACGAAHSVAVDEWGQVFCWGEIVEGQVHWTLNGETPTLVKSLAKHTVVQIASGLHHVLVLTSAGELYTWGSNAYGQLGICDLKTKFADEPVKITALDGIPISMIACGGNHSFALSKSGAVFSWGKNSNGQLGTSDEKDHCVPYQLRDLRSLHVKYIQCGEDFTVFLTKDGGVLNCGAGLHGQLGHGDCHNEVSPRKIIELMGSTVTQVAVGRRHTLAYVASTGRLFAFGVNTCGQLGNGNFHMSAVPVPVKLHSKGHSPAYMIKEAVAKEECPMIVSGIFAGGHQSFAAVIVGKDGMSKDYRYRPECTQVVTISPLTMKQLVAVTPKDIVSQDLLSYLETVFSSQACWNASFLLAGDGHMCCTSRHMGIDLEEATKAFYHISVAENSTILDVIFTCITDNMLPSLRESPPDVETLRVYMLLPLYHEFENSRHYLKLQSVFCKAFLKLSKRARTIVGNWWCRAPLDYFEKLIRVYKNVVLYLVSQPQVYAYRRGLNVFNLEDGCLEAALDMLRELMMLNHLAGLKVPYDTFYMPELQTTYDMRTDYIYWLAERGRSANNRTSIVNFEHRRTTQNLYLCSYAFLFDTPAKAVLLQTDQAYQMCTSGNMGERYQGGVLLLPQAFNQAVEPVGIESLLLIVSRDNLVCDTINNLSMCNTKDLKRPLKVQFVGEEAEDIGGVTKEFFLLLLRDVLNPQYGMFTLCPETNLIYLNQFAFEDESRFFLVGLILGMAIYNFIVIDVPLPVTLYKKLLNEKVDLSDLYHVAPTVARNLQTLLDYTDSDIEQVFDLHFVITYESYGAVHVVNLKPKGDEIVVTQANKAEFVELYVDHMLNKSIDAQFNAFSKGFNRVCGGRILELFHSHELMAVITGNENYNWDELENSTEYRGGYTTNDLTIRLFWQVFHELSLEHKKMFLLFLTGCDRVPILGMQGIKLQIQPVADERCLPVAHTCFNLLDLPRYKTKEKLSQKLLQAIYYNQGFSLV